MKALKGTISGTKSPGHMESGLTQPIAWITGLIQTAHKCNQEFYELCELVFLLFFLLFSSFLVLSSFLLFFFFFFSAFFSSASHKLKMHISTPDTAADWKVCTDQNGAIRLALTCDDAGVMHSTD